LTLDEFWQEFLVFSGKDRATKYIEAFHFNASEEYANNLINLVLMGKKRATASTLTAYEYSGNKIPQIGDYSIVTDCSGNPRCVIRTTAITILPFNEITFDICKREGEDECLETWQDGHRRCFAEEGRALGYEFSEDMQVVFEDFELIFSR